jgi:hypothetical protein
LDRTGLRRVAELARASDKLDADRGREQRVQHEIERLTDAIAQMDLSTALAERLRKAEGERDAPKRARTRAAVAPLPSAIRAQVHAPVTGLDVALRTDVGRTRDALRAVLGDVQLIEENGSVYAECDNAAERHCWPSAACRWVGLRGQDLEPGCVFGSLASVCKCLSRIDSGSYH